MEAAQILENRLLEALINEYQGNCYTQWLESERDERNEIHARARAAADLLSYIQNKAQDIVNGYDTGNAPGEGNGSYSAD